jgi:hypothetical protein
MLPLIRFDYLKFEISTTSDRTRPRAIARFFPIRLQAKEKIRCEEKLLTRRGAPPDNGCSQMLPAPITRWQKLD